MIKEANNYCCECGCRVVILTTGAIRVNEAKTKTYYLCLDCLAKQPARPKWNISRIGEGLVFTR
jgi:hypothetical protein